MSGHGLETANVRRQAKRLDAALRLAQRPDLRLELAAGRKVVVAVRDLRAELAPFLEARACVACGGGLVGPAVRVAGGNYHVHAYCLGRRRG